MGRKPFCGKIALLPLLLPAGGVEPRDEKRRRKGKLSPCDEAADCGPFWGLFCPDPGGKTLEAIHFRNADISLAKRIKI